MTTKRRLGNKEEFPDRYGVNQDIYVYYELDFKGHTIKTGDVIKFKGEKGNFRFKNWAHNVKKDVQWIDCFDEVNGVHRSFYISDLKGLGKIKKSRKKKLV